MIFSKGMDPEHDDYSACHARSSTGQLLPDVLMAQGVTHFCVCGLATDYCVRQTALEALARGFVVSVLIDAVAGVDLVPGDSQRALAEIAAAGARLVTLEMLQGEG
jgi:nicotinamidase/pyrazinamidase